MVAIDQVQLNFNPDMLGFINWMLAVVSFGVALDLRVADFQRVLRRPKAPLVGLISQFLIMPAVATVLVIALQPSPSMALGIILVAACPGGNVSNFLTNLARGNAAVSVSMSAISTLVSVVMTPANFVFWANINPQTRPLLEDIALSPVDILQSVLVILILPTVLGMLTRQLRPEWAQRALKPMQMFSMLVLFGFIAAALQANFSTFVAYVGEAFWTVLLVNGCGLLLGYGLARGLRLEVADARAVSFETGIQNSGFGLLLVFQFFGGLGGMAIVVAWWGIWHLVSGLALACLWRVAPEWRLISSPLETPAE